MSARSVVGWYRPLKMEKSWFTPPGQAPYPDTAFTSVRPGDRSVFTPPDRAPYPDTVLAQRALVERVRVS